MLGTAAIRRLAISRSFAKGEVPTVKTVPKPPATSLSVQFFCRLALSTAIFIARPLAGYENPAATDGPQTRRWELLGSFSRGLSSRRRLRRPGPHLCAARVTAKY